MLSTVKLKTASVPRQAGKRSCSDLFRELDRAPEGLVILRSRRRGKGKERQPLLPGNRRAADAHVINLIYRHETKCGHAFVQTSEALQLCKF